MSPEQELKKKTLEKEMYDHYVKVMESMLKWCIYNQPEDIEVITKVFKVDRQPIALKAMGDVLNKWRHTNDNKSSSKKRDR